MHKESLKLVFSNPMYLVISGSIFLFMLVLLLYFQEYLFFEPFLVFHIPQGMFPSFVSIIAVSALIGLVLSLTIFQIYTQKTSTKKTSTGLVGSFIGAGVCTSCGSLALPIISILGVAGASSLSFLTIYEFPIRLGAIAILIGSYFFMVRGISKECKIRIDEK